MAFYIFVAAANFLLLVCIGFMFYASAKGRDAWESAVDKARVAGFPAVEPPELGFLAGGFDNYVWAQFVQLRDAGALTVQTDGMVAVHRGGEVLGRSQAELLNIVERGTSIDSVYFSRNCPLLQKTADVLETKGLWQKSADPSPATKGLRGLAFAAVGVGFAALFTSVIGDAVVVADWLLNGKAGELTVVGLVLAFAALFGYLFAGPYRQTKRWVFGKLHNHTFAVAGTTSPLALALIDQLREVPQFEPAVNAALYGGEYVLKVDPAFGATALAWIQKLYEVEDLRGPS